MQSEKLDLTKLDLQVLQKNRRGLQLASGWVVREEMYGLLGVRSAT